MELGSATSVPPFEAIEEVDENLQPASPTKDTTEKRTPRKPRQEVRFINIWLYPILKLPKF